MENYAHDWVRVESVSFFIHSLFSMDGFETYLRFLTYVPVMRTSGNLKVILNSSLVVGMSFSKSNEKSLRFTNVDGIYTVKVTLSTYWHSL